MKLTAKQIMQNWEVFLGHYYKQPCKGCLEPHYSFWATITESEEWRAWRQHAWVDNMLYDFPEVEELGIISPAHFQDFLKFTFKNKKWETS